MMADDSESQKSLTHGLTLRDFVRGKNLPSWTFPFRLILRVLSWIYAAGVASRNFLFDDGWRTVRRLPIPVLAVGNITTGGTGKTPFVAWLVSELQRQKRLPGLISRGYRSGSANKNDEYLLLERLVPGVPHVQNANRFEAGQTLLAKHKVDVLVADDAFQHRQLHRDLNIVLIDATDPWGGGKLLPAGLLRELRSSLYRASVIMMTRVSSIDESARDELRKEIRSFAPTIPIAEIDFVPTLLVDAKGNKDDLGSLVGKTVLGICGIGNPQSFWNTVTSLGMKLERRIEFPDHHHFSDADFNRINLLAEHVDAVVMTEKDMVKWKENVLSKPVWAIRITTVFREGEDLLRESIQSALVGYSLAHDS